MLYFTFISMWFLYRDFINFVIKEFLFHSYERLFVCCVSVDNLSHFGGASSEAEWWRWRILPRLGVGPQETMQTKLGRVSPFRLRTTSLTVSFPHFVDTIRRNIHEDTMWSQPHTDRMVVFELWLANSAYLSINIITMGKFWRLRIYESYM